MVLAFGSAAFAQTDCKKLVPASPWGPNDQTGATNRITPAVTKAAAAEIKDGKVIVMSYPLTDGVPLFGTRFTKTILTATSLAPGAAFGENELTYMEDTWLSQSHVGTHLDGMGHIGRKDCYYNQIPMGKFINQNNMTKLGLEHLKSFATRGVLVDMVKVFQAANKFKGNAACKKPCLDKGTVITAADIQAGLKMYNVTLREGDISPSTPVGETFSSSSRPRTRCSTRARRIGMTRRRGSSPRRSSRSATIRGASRSSPGRTRRKPSSSTTCCSPTTASTSSRTCGPT
jgi:hypothetical protein